MSQSTKLFIALFAMFVLFATMRGTLAGYLQVISS